jgi:hypothetical protein
MYDSRRRAVDMPNGGLEVLRVKDNSTLYGVVRITRRKIDKSHSMAIWICTLHQIVLG